MTKTFPPTGRKVAWIAIIIGLFLILDALWCVSKEQWWAALVVGGVGLERWVYAWTDYWHRQQWPFQLSRVSIVNAGLEFEERDAYRGEFRTSLVPGGCVLDARVRRVDGPEPWQLQILTIFGTFVWSTYTDENLAFDELDEVRASLDKMSRELLPPQRTGHIDIVPQSHAAAWGMPRVVPGSIALRTLLLLSTIVALPNLASGNASMALWLLTAVTVVLLAFPFVGALKILRRPGETLGFGVSMQGGELRAWERSTVTQVVPLAKVRHLGFGTLELRPGTLSMHLIAMNDEDTPVEEIVPRSTASWLATQACRVLAEQHDPASRAGALDWSVRMPGGIAEAIETVSYAQGLLATAKGKA